MRLDLPSTSSPANSGRTASWRSSASSSGVRTFTSRRGPRDQGARPPRPEQVTGEVFNVGRSGENYRKLDLVEEIRRVTDQREVEFVHRNEDPRDYKVSFDKIRNALGFETQMTVPDGIAEVLAALEQERFGDPFDGRYRNIP